MRKSLIVCFMMLAAFSIERAWSQSCSQYQWCDCCCIRDASIEFNLGYRTDEFKWRFNDGSTESALDDLTPFFDFINCSGIQSIVNGTNLGCLINSVTGFDNTYQSQWRHMRMVNFGLKGKIDTDCCLYASGRANFGWVCDGQYKPSGLFSGNGEFYENILSNFGLAPQGRKRPKGFTWEILAGVGYNFRFCCDTFQIAPVIGWDYHRINFHTKKYEACTHLDYFFAAIDLETASKAEFKSYWTGPYIGFDSKYQWDCRWSLDCTFEYHYTRQHGNGEVKSFEDFAAFEFNSIDALQAEAFSQEFLINFAVRNKFRTRTNFSGIFVGGGINYNFNECWYVGFHVDYWNMRKSGSGSIDVCSEGGILIHSTDKGENTINRPIDRCGPECLKYSRWNSLRFELALGLNF